MDEKAKHNPKATFDTDHKLYDYLGKFKEEDLFALGHMSEPLILPIDESECGYEKEGED